jgi:hypothetical protein
MVSRIASVQRRGPTKARREHAVRLLTDRLTSAGFRVEPGPPDCFVDLLITRDGVPLLVKLLAAAAPHHRGGTGSLGLHWMLPETIADRVALVDLARSVCWILPSSTFREEAQPLAGGRHHLDWIVVPLGKPASSVPMETEFDKFKLPPSQAT